MQQVFNIVNTLLEKDPVTNQKKLLIRTYKASSSEPMQVKILIYFGHAIFCENKDIE